MPESAYKLNQNLATMIEYFEPVLQKIATFNDARGQLSVLEQQNLPFEIKRVYYLYDIPIGAIRGEHAHKRLQQFMICMNGACEITFNDGAQQSKFLLDSPSQGVLVPPGLWRSIRFNLPGSVLCVLASEPYDPDEYIYSFEEFLRYSQGKRGGRK